MKWVVGQDVYMFPGMQVYGFWKGKVVKASSEGVDVKLDEPLEHYEHIPPDSPNSFRKDKSIIRFAKDGTGWVDGGKWNVAPEQQPWILDDMPFEERRVSLENHQRIRKFMKALVIGQEVWMIRGRNSIKGKVVEFIPPVIHHFNHELVEVQELREGGELKRFFCYDGTQFDGSHYPASYAGSHDPESRRWHLDDRPPATAE